MPSIKQSSLMLYLVMILGLALGFFYNSQSDPALEIPVISTANQLTSLKGLENLKIDYSLFENPSFQSLRVFGELPVRTQSGGKTNLFQ